MWISTIMILTSQELSFNRYMVECEFAIVIIVINCCMVLIDTWWNVNIWSTANPIKSDIGFNRYMVECELLYFYYFLSGILGFNRYMVECECVTISLCPNHAFRFNRYMVECEWKC